MRAFLLLAVAMAACESDRPPPCPGSPVATFSLATALVDGGSSCAPDAGLSPGSSFTAILAWDPVDGGAAALCIQRPDAQPHLGTHQGDQVQVQHTTSDITIPGCSCPDGGTMTILEVIDGGVLRGDGGMPVGFSGIVQDHVSAASDCGCGLPCTVSYTLDGGG